MRTNFHFPTICMALALFGITLCFTENHSQASMLAPQVAGEDGADGVDGDPGTDGEDGTDASDVETEATEQSNFNVFGAEGGQGGIGGNGIDGDDDGTSAMGGSGGNGGRGSHVHLTRNEEDEFSSYVTFSAIGGRGGAGGKGGFGTGRDLEGIGGNGGHGGRAMVSSDIADSGRFSARGGNGGDSTGTGGIAGNGGRAYVTTQIQETFRWASFNQTGGVGGFGYDGANGGRGASSTMGFNSQQLTLEGIDDDSVSKTINFNITGGRGGDSVNGQVGRGGTARLSLEFLEGVSSSPLRVYANIRAGQGGRGISTGSQDTDGVGGAVALLKSTEDVSMRLGSYYLQGGNGGSALGRQNRGDGGNGAAAIVDGPLVVRSDQYSTSLSLSMVGGIGGHAQGTGWAGNGGSVVAPEIEIDGIENVYLSAYLGGGDGGWGQRNGSGGDAIFQYENENPAEEGERMQEGAFYGARSQGGNAGQGLNSVIAATGGDAVAEISQSRSSSFSVDSIAQGGFGNNGASGNATAKAIARSLFDERIEQSFVDARANAATRYGFQGNWRPSHGTSSVAEAAAINENIGDTSSNASAYGGWGFLEGGDVQASATSHSMSEESNAYATARSWGYGSTNDTEGNIADSTAAATSGVNGVAAASAASDRTGHDITSRAVALATGGSISGYSSAISKTRAWEHFARVTAQSTSDGSEGNLVSVENISLVQFRSTNAIADPVFEGNMTASLLINPLKDQVADFIESESDFGEVFLGSEDADVIGVGSFLSAGAEGGQLDSSATVDLNLEIQESQTGGRFQIGFFGLGDDFGGFEELSFSGSLNGREFINESWVGEDSGIAAMEFLDNLLLDVTDTPENLESIDLLFQLDTISSGASDRFGLGFVFGNVDESGQNGDDNFRFQAFPRTPNFTINAVPEPGSAALVMSVGLLAMIRRRR